MDDNVPPSDAMSDASIPASSESVVRVEDLGRLIRIKRGKDQLTLEQVAKRSGVSAATLSRLERQYMNRISGGSATSYPQPDTRTLHLVTSWLGVSIGQVADVGATQPQHAIVHHEGETVPDMVEAHLRADRNLTPKTARALSRLFRAAYEQLADYETTSEEGDRDESKTDE